MATVDYSTLPSFQVAADNHNINGGGFSLLDPTTWGEGVKNAGRFMTVSALSGVNSFYNTAVTYGNWLGGDRDQRDTAQWISDFDRDLGKYYESVEGAADTVGFIAGSLIPGMAGVKLLNVGQKAILAAKNAGQLGGNLGKATGLLAPNTERFVRAAGAELAASGSQFTLLNANVAQGLARGAGNALLESAAFEVAAYAALSQAPIFDQMDAWDVAQNIAMGALLGAGVGGIFEGLKLRTAVRKEIASADELLNPYRSVSKIQQSALNTPANRIVGAVDDLVDMPPPSALADSGLSEQATRLFDSNTRKLQDQIRIDLHELTPANAALGNQLGDLTLSLSPQNIKSNFMHAESVVPVGTMTKGELRLNRAIETQDKLAGRLVEKASKKNRAALTEHLKEVELARQGVKVAYVKAAGEGMGGVSFQSPTQRYALDSLPAKSGKTPKQWLEQQVANARFNITKPWSLTASTDPVQAELRYYWAEHLGLEDLRQVQVFRPDDIPLLEAASRHLDSIVVANADGTTSRILGRPAIEQYIKGAKDDLAVRLYESGVTDVESIARAVNVRKSYLEGTEVSDNVSRDIFARRSLLDDYTNTLRSSGQESPAAIPDNLSEVYQHFKIEYNASAYREIDPFEVDAVIKLREKEKLAAAAIDNVVAQAVGADNLGLLPKIGDNLLRSANRHGAGAGWFASANASYGSLASAFEQVGRVTAKIRMQWRQATTDSLQDAMVGLRKNAEAAVEFSAVNERVAATAEQYVLNAAGDALIPRKVHEYLEAIGRGERVLEPKIQDGAPLEIPLNRTETRAAVVARINSNANRVTKETNLRAAQGLENNKDPSIFYPLRPDPRDYKHFAFVRDPKVTGSGHVVMIHAASEAELNALIAKVPSEFETLTSRDTARFYQARKEYEFDRTLNENYVNSKLRSNGVNSQFFPKTDSQRIVEDWLHQEHRADDTLVREIISAKYDKQFRMLREFAHEPSMYATSLRHAEAASKDPAMSYIKTALDISKLGETPQWAGLNNVLDSAYSRAVSGVADLFRGSTDQATITQINTVLAEQGIKSAYYDAATHLYANHRAPKGLLSRHIAAANATLSTLVLRLDFLNSLNNAVGMGVMASGETRYVVEAIKRGDANGVGVLARLSEVGVPGTQDSILSPTKLIANSIKRFVQDDGTLVAEYTRNGWIIEQMQQFRMMLDDMTLQGSESAAQLDRKFNGMMQKAKSFADAGERYTGNKLSEQFNRFVSADIMKQLTDIAVDQGLMNSREAAGYISTFVNRVNGNLVASQRPLVFQGPVGQALGLFQTYQFNILQQLLRYVGEGRAKDAAVMMGMQGTLYGLSGLPFFDMINQNLIGQAAGNTNHADLYDLAYGAGGSGAADFLMYGLPSNILQVNLFTRGDINPRHPTILPTNPLNFPVIDAAIRTFGGVKAAVTEAGTGSGVWNALLRGLEHNGFNRPLSGLAQVMRGIETGNVQATDRAGSIIWGNDLLSWASVARLAGGKPLDEAITRDYLFNVKAYQAADNARVQSLGTAFKSRVLTGEPLTQEDIESFATEYVSRGGKQENFNRWMMDRYKDASVPAAQQLASSLNNSYSQKMQEIMQGRDLGWQAEIVPSVVQ